MNERSVSPVPVPGEARQGKRSAVAEKKYQSNLMTTFRSLFRWERGRQRSGYDKMLLCGARWPVKFDTYLLKFPEGSEILPHTDQVTSGEHFRLNVILRHAELGGVFGCSNTIFETKRIKVFRPDISEHSVTRIVKGNRYVLSIGWVKGS